MNEKSITKYVNLGFNVIVDDESRREAELRCSQLESYYQEKIDLVESAFSDTQRPNSTNRAGFFIKALQEDWQNPKAFKEQQEKEAQKARLNIQKRLKELDSKKESMKKQMEVEKNKIYDLVTADGNIFNIIFEETKKGVTAFRDTVFPADLSAIECFKKGGMSRNLIVAKMEELFPEKFAAINDLFKTEIQLIDKEFMELKKR